MKINHWFEARHDEIEKSGDQNNQLSIMLLRTYLIFPMSEFQNFVLYNKENWEKGDVTDSLVLVNVAQSKFRIIQEDKLWVTNDPMKANMLALTTVIVNITRQLDSKGTTKQSNKSFGNSNSSTVTSVNNEKYDAPNLEN